ncbi:MAG: hypothetical protein DSZ24_06080 [Thermodesulfatator sp.]|nr:MAG: hypothetical protein DSZ24_06080 [Thermodesulfatator sp.]
MRKIVFLFLLLFPFQTWAMSPSTEKQILMELAEIKATLRTFMEVTNKRFEDMNKRFEDMNKRFEDINKRFEDMNKRFEALQEEMNRRFEALQREMDKRFEEVDKRFEQVDKRFEQMDKRFEQMMTFLWILTAIFTTLTAVVIGFAYWDRRTIIRRAREETLKDLEEGKLGALLRALKELAREDRRLAEILRSYGLL